MAREPGVVVERERATVPTVHSGMRGTPSDRKRAPTRALGRGWLPEGGAGRRPLGGLDDADDLAAAAPGVRVLRVDEGRTQVVVGPVGDEGVGLVGAALLGVRDHLVLAGPRPGGHRV